MIPPPDCGSNRARIRHSKSVYIMQSDGGYKEAVATTIIIFLQTGIKLIGELCTGGIVADQGFV